MLDYTTLHLPLYHVHCLNTPRFLPRGDAPDCVVVNTGVFVAVEDRLSKCVMPRFPDYSAKNSFGSTAMFAVATKYLMSETKILQRKSKAKNICPF